jgi:hypothetical protein
LNEQHTPALRECVIRLNSEQFHDSEKAQTSSQKNGNAGQAEVRDD